jgi:UDP-N-acetylmuramoyl-L-alanyl-D-glutamate--2,6-diaminopimelate ligase
LYNVAAAIGTAVALRIPAGAIVDGINALQDVPGRFQPVNAGQPFRVIVDYAHTDDALEKVLKSAREITEGRLIVVFGCGGDRDQTKRSVMGEVAARASDYAVVTSDNPRSEDPLAIIRQVEDGLVRAGAERGTSYELVPDRRAAILAALRNAAANDTVVVAGKGHEPYQEIGNQTFKFDDRTVVRELLDELRVGRH